MRYFLTQVQVRLRHSCVSSNIICAGTPNAQNASSDFAARFQHTEKFPARYACTQHSSPLEVDVFTCRRRSLDVCCTQRSATRDSSRFLWLCCWSPAAGPLSDSPPSRRLWWRQPQHSQTVSVWGNFHPSQYQLLAVLSVLSWDSPDLPLSAEGVGQSQTLVFKKLLTLSHILMGFFISALHFAQESQTCLHEITLEIQKISVRSLPADVFHVLDIFWWIMYLHLYQKALSFTALYLNILG